MNQSRFPCRECGKVKVKDERTRAVKGGFVCGECTLFPYMDFTHAAREPDQSSTGSNRTVNQGQN